MVLHAGIVCYEKTKKGKLVIYNTETKERITKDVMTVGPGDNSGVDELFKSIQSYFTAPKGCLCICLGNKYDSEIRKKFIETGKANGFTKVGITDWLSADYCALVSATDLYGKVETLKGLIYIFCGKTCRIWRKDNDRARFVKEIKYEDTIGSLQEIKKIGEEKGKFPDLVIYGDKLKPHYEQAKNIFGRDKVTVYSELNQENGVLIKARIMGKDKDMKKYSTEVLLEQFAELKIGGVPITSAKMWQSLPFNYENEIVKPDGVTDLEMFSYFKSNKKWLPNSKKFTVKFNIDVNGICSVDFDTGDENPNTNLKNQGKKYSSNNSLPTDAKPKFQPRAQGQQQQQRPRFNPPPAQEQQPQQPRGLQNNFTRGKHSFSTSSLASNNSENSTNSTNSRGGRGGGRGRGGGNNRGRGGNRGVGNQNQNNYANLPQDPIPGLPTQLQHGYPQIQQNHQMAQMPYGGNGQINMGIHHALSAPGQLPQFPQQQPYYVNPSYPTSPQQFMPPQMGYSNGNYTMNPGYTPNQPQYLPNHLQNMNIHQAPPPPYPGAPASDTTSNNFNEKKTKNYQKPACPPGSLNQFPPSGNQGKGQKKNSKQ